MEVAIRKKRSSISAATGLGVHGTAGGGSSGVVSAYGSLTGPTGLSSGATRRSFGAAAEKPTTLSFYNDAPQQEVTMDQFERAGVDRLQALKQCEAMRLRKHAAPLVKLANDPTDSPLSTVLLKYNLGRLEYDNLSHFVLRLAYCKTEELRRWLITQEALLFKYRFDSEKEEAISEFLLANDLQYAPLTVEELNVPMPRDFGADAEEGTGTSRAPLLKELLRQVPFADPQQLTYYKVPFEDAIDLLRERKVFLSRGFAFVSRANLSTIITTKFRARLSAHLGMTCRAVGQMKQDPRIVPLLGMLSKSYITPLYKTGGKVEGAVTKEQLPTLAERSMPLCMSTTFTHLKEDNHLKHGGRMQLGLFLKGIGLSLADALLFWKSSFARRTPPERFDKEYAYNIRHNYGKEGKRTTYTPYGCMKIISGSGTADPTCGCPFAAAGDEQQKLRDKMRRKNFTAAQTEDIAALVKGQHFQVACQRWYAYTHPGGSLDGGNGAAYFNHPNAYFDMSENYWRDQEAGGTGAAGGAKPAASAASSATPGVYNAIPQYGGFAASPAAVSSATASSPAAAAASSSSPASASAATVAAASSSPAVVADAAAGATSQPPNDSGPAPMDIIADDTPAATQS